MEVDSAMIREMNHVQIGALFEKLGFGLEPLAFGGIPIDRHH